MLNSLRVRLLLLFMVVVAVALGTVALLASQITSCEFQRFVARDAERDQRFVSTLLNASNQNQSPAQMQAITDQVSQDLGRRVVLVGEQQRVVADSDHQLVGQILEYPPSVAGLVVALGEAPLAQASFTTTFPLAYEVPSPGDCILVQATPIQFVAGTSVDVIPFESAQSVSPTFIWSNGSVVDPFQVGFLRAINQALLVAVIVAGVVALALTLLLARGILRPIGALTAAARSMEQGDLSRCVPVRGKDEIGLLAHAFNAMADGLSRQEQLRRTMVTDVAHELRTPLTNIRGYLEAVRDGVAPPTPALIESLHEEAMLLNRLVDDLQDMALADAGQLRLERRLINVEPLITQAIHALSPTAVEHELKMSANLPADLPAVDADAERVGQVLRNLLHNAITHTPPGGSITVSAHFQANTEGSTTSGPLTGRRVGVEPSSFVVISVCDSGTGIAPEHLPSIFERFYRADPSRTRATGGAGLGLFIVKQLVEAHGGRVWAESAPSRGSQFSFTLPVHSAEPGLLPGSVEAIQV